MRPLLILTIHLVSLSICAQVDTRKNSLLAALNSYEESLSITFSYDAEVLNLIDDNLSFEANDFNSFKSQVESFLSLKIVKIEEKYFTISTTETSFRLTVRDSIDDSEIPEELGVQVLINRTPIEVQFENGEWLFQYTPDISHNVEVYSDGYVPTIIPFESLIQRKNISVALGLRTKYLNPVIIEDYLTKGINLSPSNQQIKINVDDLPLLPGETDGDIFSSIAALPGITTPDGRAGNLFIRGSETDQSLVLFDNIPIYHRGHYYGTISPYNPKIVKNVEVYRSGFHPRYGDRVGGAIMINSDESQNASTFGVGANTLFGMAYGKFNLSKKLSGSFSIRNSYPRTFKSPKLEAISESVFDATSLVAMQGFLTKRVEVNFNDYNAKLAYQINDRNSLRISAIHTVSDINFSPVTPDNVPQRLNDNNYTNSGINLLWESDLGDGWNTSFSSTYSKYDFQFTINTLAPNIEPLLSDNGIVDLNLVQEFSKKSSNSNLQFGLDYKLQKTSTDYRNQLQDSSIYVFQKEVTASTIAPFANFEFYGWEKWFVQLGFRSSYYSELNDFSISPRVLLNYDLSEQVILKGAHGWYNQFLSQVKNLEYTNGGFDNELWVLADNETGFIIRGTQSMLGGTMNINNWIFDVEGFFKTANNITIYEELRLNPEKDFYTMDQETYGLDILLKKQVSEELSLWTGYSYHDSKITIDTTDEISYKSKFVQPHVWYTGGAFKKNRWKISLGWRYSSGLHAFSLDIATAESVFIRGPQSLPPLNGAPPPQNPFDELPERYPNVHSLDISASYKIPKTDQRKWSASLGLSLINTLNQSNLTDRVYRSREGFVDREAIGFAPNLMVIFEW